MAKRKTPKVDLGKKLTKEELEGIQKHADAMNMAKLQIADIEIRKHAFIHNFVEMQQKMQAISSELEEKYGKVDVDLRTGQITEKKDGESNS
jgi:cell fate (sporulation/competence/biofilm development) regulator YlbF (YheA/YmcA/DUF963 family)